MLSPDVLYVSALEKSGFSLNSVPSVDSAFLKTFRGGKNQKISIGSVPGCIKIKVSVGECRV